MKKAKGRKHLKKALETIEALNEDLDCLDGKNEELMIEVATLKKENALLRHKLGELTDENKIKSYVSQVRQLHGVSACERDFIKERFVDLHRQLECAEKAAIALLDSINSPIYEALQPKVGK